MDPSTVAIILVAGLHIVFFVLESLLWTTPTVRRIFKNTKEEAAATDYAAASEISCATEGSALQSFSGPSPADRTSNVTTVPVDIGAPGGKVSSEAKPFFPAL